MPDISPPDSPDNHGDLMDLAFPYALDAVSAAETADIEQRLRAADQETVRAFDSVVRDVREAMSALSVLDAQEPPAQVEARILAALAARPGARSDVHTGARRTGLGEGVPSATGPRDSRGDTAGSGPSGGPADADELARARRRRRRRLSGLAAAAAVVVAIGIGFGVLGRQTGDEPGGAVTAQQILEQPDARTSTTPVGVGGTLTVRFSAELGAATVAFDAVPAPPDGSDYQLWLIDATGVPQPAGVLPELPAADAPYITEFSGSEQLAVTLEPDGGSPAPTSTPLGAVTLG
ncbi:anti-sigma factor domain-containing protein [Nocardia sp. NPDC058499]|uniref:anti-sigma factor n=1 Tax=Nocardia sp. NPDC058499 TaxID=3346530 RepID=UPI003659DE46